MLTVDSHHNHLTGAPDIVSSCAGRLLPWFLFRYIQNHDVSLKGGLEGVFNLFQIWPANRLTTPPVHVTFFTWTVQDSVVWGLTLA